MKGKPKPKADEIEEFPDAWERFEKAFDTVMKTKPKPRSGKNVTGTSPRRKKPDARE
jgi:hypothetical protein